MSSSEKVRASHILIKHQGSRRKSSWKDPDGRLISATTREEAVSQLEALRSYLDKGDATFHQLATEHSHCSSAKRGGDLGPFFQFYFCLYFSAVVTAWSFPISWIDFAAKLLKFLLGNLCYYIYTDYFYI